MVGRAPSRRAVLLGAAALAAAGSLRAGAVVDLTWRDLLPAGAAPLPHVFQDLLPHDETGMPALQPVSTGTRRDWNGQAVRISGFVVPLTHDGAGVTAFILAPFVGACIHVPPPPANQLVLVTTSTPYIVRNMFEAVTVTGTFGAASTTTELAEIGYAISAEDIRRHRD